MATNIDTDFQRFQQTRNPEALATVFDEAAPRLLLVAMHLCRDAAAAEDLVQTVFLQAIRDVEQFDASRPVMPWLIGILEHRAQDRRDRAHVSRERGSRVLATVGSAVADPAPGPQSAAEDAELRAQVSAALDGVPAKYREVLTLRLVHGLRAVDIAHAQGVSPQTIRTKLRRGLSMLRSSLPRGVATGAMLTLLATECLRASNGLPAVRRSVLGTIAPPTTAVVGSLAINWLWGIGIAAAMVIGGMFLVTPPDPTVPKPDEHAQLPLPATGSTASNTLDADAARLPAPSNATASMRATATTVVSGLIVTAEHQQPIANATVSLRTYSSPTRGGVPSDWTDPRPVRTDTQGVFEFAFVPPPELYFEFKAQARGFVTEWQSYESLRQGIQVDAGTIELVQGTPLRLRVLVEGQPYPGLEIYANRSKDGGQPAGMYGQEDTDQEGYSDFGMCQPGTWFYDVHSHLAGPEQGKFELPLQAGMFEHTIHLTIPAAELTVAGTLVDQFAQPLAGLELEMPSPDDFGYSTATTNKDGAFLFSLRQVPDGQPEFQLRLPSNRTDLEWIQSGGKFHWGRNDLELIVRRREPASLRLEVVDAETGEPVEHFGARCIPDPWRKVGHSPVFAPVASRRHSEGVQRFDKLRPAPYRVSVFPPAPYVRQTWLRTELFEGKQTTLRVLLHRPAPLRVTIVEASSNRPMTNVHAALCRVLPEDRFAEVRLGKYRTAFDRRGTGRHGSGLNVVVVDDAQSGEDGKVTLHAAADTEALAVFVTSPRIKDQVVPIAAITQDGSDLQIVVEAAATLHGTLMPMEFVTRLGPDPEDLREAAEREALELPKPNQFDDHYPEVTLRSAHDHGITFSTYVDKEGKFAFESMPPDTYEVWLEATLWSSRNSSSNQEFGPLTTVTLTATRAIEPITLDASHLLPARAVGRYFVDGKPWQGEVGLARVTESSTSKIRMITNDDGLRSSPWIKPGSYLPFATVTHPSGRERAIFGLERITIEPGKDVEFTAVLQRRRVVVTLRDANDQPLANRRIVPQSLDHPQLAFEWRYGARTDENGRAVFDPAPLGRLRIMAFDPAQKLGREYVQPQVLLGELGANDRELTASWPQ